MNRMRVVIVDDEPLARRGIRQLLSGATDVEIAGEARNGREAVRLLKLLSPDLVFLDVQMPECDGFDVLRQLHRHRLPLLVFVTAYDTFAIRAFDAHAVDIWSNRSTKHGFSEHSTARANGCAAGKRLRSHVERLRRPAMMPAKAVNGTRLHGD
jgi:chemotaxis response regulator CheB